MCGGGSGVCVMVLVHVSWWCMCDGFGACVVR